MGSKKCFSHAICALAAGAFTASAFAGGAPVLQMDINSLTAMVPGGFDGLTQTGPVFLSMDGNSSFAALLINGLSEPGFTGVLSDFQGTVNLENGVVVGGTFHVELASGETYDTAIAIGVGTVDMSVGETGPFTMDGETFSGEFDNLLNGAGHNFGSVDVTPWHENQPDPGSFFMIKLDATEGVVTTDDDVDIEIFVIPGTPPPPNFCKEHEPNDFCETKNTFDVLECPSFQGILEERLVPGPQPDTWLCVVDKFDNIIASDDNGATQQGNGKGSGLWSSDVDNDGHADILIDNGDGTYSLRLVVTGFPDGFDGNCNGFFMNAPHGQIGQFCLSVEYVDVTGATIRTDTYTDEFITGAEAFRLNFTAPAGSTDVHIEIDNTCGRDVVCVDRDFFCYTGLEPLAAYCITQVSGLTFDTCEPTDTVLGWFDKNCNLIRFDDDSGPGAFDDANSGYSELCVVADNNGVITFGVTGHDDFDFDGYSDGSGNTVPHGVCGTYMLQIRRADGSPLDPPVPCASVPESVQNGDINSNGVVDGADLAIILSNWGMPTIAPPQP